MGKPSLSPRYDRLREMREADFAKGEADLREANRKMARCLTPQQMKAAIKNVKGGTLGRKKRKSK